jgi:ankyrin repeat protein
VTALHSAAHHGNIVLVQLLLKHGANVDAKMKNGKSALDFAIESSHQEIVEVLQNLKSN